MWKCVRYALCCLREQLRKFSAKQPSQPREIIYQDCKFLRSFNSPGQFHLGPPPRIICLLNHVTCTIEHVTPEPCNTPLLHLMGLCTCVFALPFIAHGLRSSLPSQRAGSLVCTHSPAGQSGFCSWWMWCHRSLFQLSQFLRQSTVKRNY